MDRGEQMSLQAIILLVSQLVSLVIKLVDEIKKVSDLSESDTEALKKSVKEIREKVAAIDWKD